MLEHGPIQELPLSHPHFRKQVEAFLLGNGLRMEELDHYYAWSAPDGSIIAGAGIKADIIKCVAVDSSARSEGCMLPILSRLVSDAAAAGILNLKVFTKPENLEIFESIGFREIARAPKAILMENGRGLEKYCEYLSGIRQASGCEKSQHQPDARKCGVIVMNANPFTLGHKYLIEKALEQIDHLFIIPVKEDVSVFPYSQRLAMIRAAIMPGSDSSVMPDSDRASALPSSEEKNNPSSSSSPTLADARVTVLEGSEYCISAATFPTYFLKDLSDAAETQMRLDLDLFSRWISPALGNPVRFVGSEPSDPLTARYNELMPNAVVVERLVMPGTDRASHAVTATAVRSALERGRYQEAAALCPVTTHPYLLAALAERALRIELDTPMKPGLVGPDSNGAHSDMNYATMLSGIKALRPFWSRMALASTPEELRTLGIEAEKAMMDATGWVNTHRGAIFALGITLNAFCALPQPPDNQSLLSIAVHRVVHPLYGNSLSDNQLRSSHIKDARAMALDGYRDLFEDWLPYYRAHGPQATLLRIMSTLDDTCVIKRVGYDRAQKVKLEAKENNDLKDMCIRYAREGISPGGAADMLALTIFIDSIIW